MALASALPESIKAHRETAEELHTSVHVALSDPDLSLEGAMRLLEVIVVYLSDVDRLFDTLDEVDDQEIDRDLQDIATETAEDAHDIGMSLALSVISRIVDLGGNGNLAFSDMQKKHSS